MNKLILSFMLCGLLAGCGGGSLSSSSASSAASSTTSSLGGSSSSSSVATVLSLGNGNGSGFTPGQIALSSASLSAGGNTTLTVSLVDQNGTLYTQSTVVTFNSLCTSQGTATITSSSVTTTTGSATATYSAQGCSGDDVITATTTANNQTLTATATVTVASAVLGSVQFQSASPATIGLKGTGVQETSKLIFKVVDSSGGPVNGAAVTFALSTTVGGLSLSNTTGTSGADGTVQTIVQAGTVHTSVRVTATATLGGVTQSTQSNNLSVTTGVPTTDAFSVAPTCPNIEAFSVDGVTAPITVRLADRYNNPVPDGTAVAFMAEGGKVDGQCTTKTTATESGVCTVNWTSQNPRPTNGRVTVLATALGEDSFVDANANGFFDSGESYTDLGEPYEDDNESGTYNLGEPFLDFNGNGVRDASYGSFKGITCTGATPGSTCSLATTAIGGQTLIVMSTSAAKITQIGAQSPATSSNGTVVRVDYNIQDLNGNSMPSGTTITLSTNTPGGTLESTASIVVPCDAGTGGINVSAYLTRPAVGTSIVGGAITVTVVSKGGLITTLRTPIS